MPVSPSRPTRRSLAVALLNLAASIHIAWFYVAYVPSELNLPRYEHGLERVPFQHRLLMTFPLRWAHDSTSLNRLAEQLTAMHAWFPHGVRPEGIVEALVDLACIIITGLVARSLYHASTRARLLGAYVYPLTVLMIAATFCMNTFHRFRFVFDLPGMAFFATGLYLIFFKRPAFLFAALFCIATVNRETSLFLLLFYLLKRYVDVSESHNASSRFARWRSALNLNTAALLIALGLFWVLWRRWVFHHFLANPTASGPRFWLNIGTLLWPLSWAQILSAFAFCLPLCLAGRKLVRNRTLRAWYLVLPVWFLFMMRYGILVEARIFGELIPYLACTATLIAEEHLLRRIGVANDDAILNVR